MLRSVYGPGGHGSSFAFVMHVFASTAPALFGAHTSPAGHLPLLGASKEHAVMLDFQVAARGVPPEGAQLPASVVIVARKDIWSEQYVAVLHVEVTVCVEHEVAPQNGPPKDRTDAVVQLPVGGAQAHGSQPGLGGSGSFPPAVVATNPVGHARPASPRLSSKATGPVHPAGGAVAHAQLGGGTGAASAASPGTPPSVRAVPVSASGVAGASPTKRSPAPVSALHASIVIDARPNQPIPRRAPIP